MTIPVGHAVARDRGAGLCLDELELYLANSSLKTEREKRSSGVFLGLAADPNSAAARSGDISGRYYGDDPRSPSQVSAILEWLNQCVEHPECNMTASGTCTIDARNVLLPTRCIDTMSKQVSLKDTSALRGSYVVLSHRWSEALKDSMTTTDNLGRRLDGHDLGSLPQTYNDAIDIAKSLGIRYLWIDSLCIVQSGDQGVNWLREAARMAQYYQEAIMTLSAPLASASEGMLLSRPHGAFQSIIRLPYLDRNNSRSGNYYLYRPRYRAAQAYDRDILRSELRSRGWIFQEWFLSRRILYYTPTQLFFECQAEMPMNERHQRISTERAYGLDLRTRFRSAEFNQWYRLVETYSRTVLTRPDKDCLMALAGVAHEFREVAKAKGKLTSIAYLSGLWLEDFAYGLLWQTMHHGKECPCQVASWSWASQLGEVKWLPRWRRMSPKVQIHPASWTHRDRAESINARLVLAGDTEASDSDSRPLQRDDHDLTAVCTQITVTGSHCSVMIMNNSYETEDGTRHRQDLDLRTVRSLARETGVELPQDSSLWPYDQGFQRAHDWYFICSTSTPNIVAGWALFDNVGPLESFTHYDGLCVFAFLVSCRKSVDTSKPGSTRGSSRDVYDVLLLKQQGDHSFCRIGIGRIFDRPLQHELDIAEEADMTLM